MQSICLKCHQLVESAASACRFVSRSRGRKEKGGKSFRIVVVSLQHMSCHVCSCILPTALHSTGCFGAKAIFFSMIIIQKNSAWFRQCVVRYGTFMTITRLPRMQQQKKFFGCKKKEETYLSRVSTSSTKGWGKNERIEPGK